MKTVSDTPRRCSASCSRSWSSPAPLGHWGPSWPWVAPGPFSSRPGSPSCRGAVRPAQEKTARLRVRWGSLVWLLAPPWTLAGVGRVRGVLPLAAALALPTAPAPEAFRDFPSCRGPCRVQGGALHLRPATTPPCPCGATWGRGSVLRRCVRRADWSRSCPTSAAGWGTAWGGEGDSHQTPPYLKKK